MDVKDIEREIEKLPKSDRSALITEVMLDLCQEVLGEAACRDQWRELFGIECLKKLDKRLKTGI